MQVGQEVIATFVLNRPLYTVNFRDCAAGAALLYPTCDRENFQEALIASTVGSSYAVAGFFRVGRWSEGGKKSFKNDHDLD